MMLNYLLAIFVMLLLAHRFFSWFRSRRNLVIVLYGLASITICIELGLVLIVTMALFESINRTVGEASLLSTSPVFPPAISYLADKINSIYITFSIISFVTTWIATALLLRQYSLKLGKVRYWFVVGLPLLYFLFQFIAFILDTYVPFITGNTVYDSILVTLIFTLSKPVRQYLTISGFGLLILFIADQAITLISIPYPPFGLATISFLGLSSYMILVGIYSSAISLAEDTTLRKSIREFTLGQSRLLDSIGSAEMQQELERKAMELIKQNQDRMAEETGIQSSLSEEDMKQYLERVIREVKMQRTSDKKSETNNGNI
jgi:hypothetical protein